MKSKLVILLSIFLWQVSFAQPGSMSANANTKGIGKISGKIIDDATGEPLEFATVSLYVQETDQLIDGTITDDKGNFDLMNLKDNTYKVEVSFLGYEPQTINDVIMEKEKNIDLGEIKIGSASALLNEVVVEGERSLIEEKVDRMVYNAENDNLAKGGDASDILRKVPLLQVDLEGNVSIRGQSNIRVLIDNKPSTIVASSIADALKMLPADEIVKVEVITSPSAKYDAEGSGGIINIITKKNKMQGYYLNINTGVGIRGSNLGLNGSLRQGKFGMSLGGHGRLFYNKAESSMMQSTLVNGITNVTDQFAEAKDNGMFGRYHLTMDYDIDKTQYLSGGIRYGLRNFAQDQQQSTDLYSDDVLLRSTLRDIESNRPSNSIDMNLDYLKTFRENQEWSISTLYSRTDMNEDFTSDLLDSNEDILTSLKNESKNLNQEFTIQTDFQTPIRDNQIFELGAKAIFRDVQSDFAYFSSDGVSDYLLDPTNPAGSLDYTQNVTAAYSTYTYSTPNKYTFKVGARWEQTSITASQSGEEINIPSYQNLVPTINASKSFANFSTVKIGYNRRIQRPWLQQLNPNFNISNNQDVRVGNPNLRPEITDNIELSYSSMIKNSFLNVSVFGRSTANAINQVRYPLDSIQGAVVTTYENIGKEESVGMNLFMNLKINENWTVNGGFDVYYSQLEGQIVGVDGNSITATNSGYNYGGRLMTQYKLPQGWTIQGFSFMHGRQVQLQGYRGGFGMYSLGFNKDFNNKKGSIGLSMDNFAGKGWEVTSELTSPTFTQTSTRVMYNRNIRLNFSYKLGKMDFREAGKKTKSVSNDDLMGGGENMNDANNNQNEQPRSNNKRQSSKKEDKKEDETKN